MKHATRPFLSLSLLLLLPVAGLAQTQPGNQGHSPLRPSADCPRLDRINEWHVVDPRTVIIRTGPDRYLVKLKTSCPRLGLGNPGLLLRANESNHAVGLNSICGEVGETAEAVYQPPCPVQSVRKIDKARFQRLSKQAKHHGSGADQPIQPQPAAAH